MGVFFGGCSSYSSYNTSFFWGGRVVVSDDLQCLLDPECWVA